MKIALKDRPMACCREISHQVKTARDEAECIVPDVYEDVGRILFAKAQILLKSKEIRDHGICIGASAEIGVRYVTERRDRVRFLKLSKAFEINFDCPEINSEDMAQVSLQCLGVQARAVNPRKISAQFSVRAEIRCWTEGCLNVPSDPEEPERGLQLRRESTECLTPVQLCEKSFVVNEQLPLGTETAEAVSGAYARLLCSDAQPIGNKMLLKGGAEVCVDLGSSEAVVPNTIEQCLPFSILIDMPDENCTLGSVTLEPTALYAELSDAINGGRVVDLELHGTAQVCFEKRGSIEYLSDAYSTRCPLITEESTVSICRGRSRESFSAETAERVKAEADRGEIAACFADILSYAARDGKAELSASVSLLLRAEDGSFDVLQRLVSLSTALPEGADELDAARITAVHARREGEEIVIALSAEFDSVQCDYARLCYLSSIEADEDESFDASTLPSLTIVKSGEHDLWELAKRYHSSVEAIREMNEKYRTEEGLLLIPRAQT